MAIQLAQLTVYKRNLDKEFEEEDKFDAEIKSIEEKFKQEKTVVASEKQENMKPRLFGWWRWWNWILVGIIFFYCNKFMTKTVNVVMQNYWMTNKQGWPDDAFINKAIMINNVGHILLWACLVWFVIVKVKSDIAWRTQEQEFNDFKNISIDIIELNRDVEIAEANTQHKKRMKKCN
ncbi:hypothetical protein VL4N_13740 [Vagococcus lutrae]|uniref:hypothetical protein n=1 Tax=Vagococcus lutrae TaxID=81947 RepID=UPI001926BABB|nr:hypothetical protein [Vagococcus lutrae]GEQ62020.1 hypothetical protein VL2N_13560 [Vagococcus lutrae]GEQ63933.1 hypothetical protein VL3N_13750 [Vagococcus lutrae]GEQ65824.1 hypothetical protein VL4N_13740 [Vagococcus lutrae]